MAPACPLSTCRCCSFAQVPSEINNSNPCTETAPGVRTIDLRNSSKKLLLVKQFLGEKIYLAEFMKPCICSFLHSICLDSEAKNQAAIAKRLYIHLSTVCMQGHPALLPVYVHYHYTSLDFLLSSYLHAIHFSIFMG